MFTHAQSHQQCKHTQVRRRADTNVWSHVHYGVAYLPVPLVDGRREPPGHVAAHPEDVHSIVADLMFGDQRLVAKGVLNKKNNQQQNGRQQNQN